MSGIRARFMIFFILTLVTIGGLTLADEGEGIGFSGNVGLELTFTPLPPLSYNIESVLSLSFSVADFTFEAVTAFDLSGFQSLGFGAAVGLGAVDIADEILFDPYFAWNQLQVDMQIVGITVGFDLILADIGTQTYSMGAVLELSSGIISGFSITTLTGFGATDLVNVLGDVLVNVLGGIEAPFSYELLELFYDLDYLCLSPIGLDFYLEPTIVSGFYFEEELVRLEVDFCGLLASSSTWLGWNGFVKEVFEFGFRFEEPNLSFLTAVTIDDSFSISGLDFIVDLGISNVHFTSWTSFTAQTPPAVIPIVFSGQKFAVSFEVFSVLITSETDFDANFLFERQRLAFEAEIDPVTFTSLTIFDGSGFSSQCIQAGVAFCGITFYTTAAFDASGITEVTVGFELTF